MRKLYIKPEGGLANRLLALTSGYSYAKFYDFELVVVWTKTQHVCCDWLDLFDNKIIKVVDGSEVKSGVVKYNVSSATLRDGGSASLNLDSENDVYISTNCLLGLPSEPRGQGFWCFSQSCSLVAPALEYFGLSSAVQSKVSKLIDSSPSYFDAIHIRRGAYDEPSSVADWNKLDDAKYLAVVKSYNVDCAFIATDSIESKEFFVKEIRNPITFEVTSFNKAEDVNAIQDAFAELLLLSKAKRIFGVQGSSFAYYAAILRNAEYIAIPAKNQTNNVKWLSHSFAVVNDEFFYTRVEFDLSGANNLIRDTKEKLIR